MHGSSNIPFYGCGCSGRHLNRPRYFHVSQADLNNVGSDRDYRSLSSSSRPLFPTSSPVDVGSDSQRSAVQAWGPDNHRQPPYETLCHLTDDSYFTGRNIQYIAMGARTRADKPLRLV